MNDQVKAIMDNLKCSEQEAMEIYEADRAIDKGEKMDFDLTPEQEKIAKKYTRAGVKTKKPVICPKGDASRRKQDPIKRKIIQDIYQALQALGYENLDILKPEKEIVFDLDGADWSISLIKHRPPKS